MRLRSTRKSRKTKNAVPSNYKMLKTSWEVQTKEFFEHSTLHGVRYIAENGRPFIEKLMWFVCVTVGAVATIVIIISLWEKFQTNPTITGLDTDFHNWKVPFPAITVCQEVPSSHAIIEEYLSERFQDSDMANSTDVISYLMQLTKLSFNTITDFVNIDSKYDFLENEKDLRQLVFQLMNKCEDVFDGCYWISYKYNCCDGFFPVFTEAGFCYTFNSRHYERKIPWDDKLLPAFEQKYIKETDIKWSLNFRVRRSDIVMPMTHIRSGIDTNITLFGVVFYADYEDAVFRILPFLMAVPSIYILNSDELAGIDVQPQHIWDFKVNTISFSVKQTYTTEDTKQLSIKQRHCAFDREIPLKFDEGYTYTSCTIQCRMNTALKICKCIPHFYPLTSGYRHCQIKELQCIADHIEEIKSVDKCGCVLGCLNTVYEVEKLNEVLDNEEDKQALEAEFVSWPMLRYKREVLFGWVDLLVSFGGIAGLFLGFSLLSGVEILYYFTIRACCMVVRDRDELIKIQEEEESKPLTDYDLSMVPYFISEPYPGNGLNEILNAYREEFTSKATRIEVASKLKPEETIIPPFGIEFIN